MTNPCSRPIFIYVGTHLYAVTRGTYGYEGDLVVPAGVSLGTPSGVMGELHPSHNMMTLDQMCDGGVGESHNVMNLDQMFLFVFFLRLYSCLDDDTTSLRQQKLEKQVGAQFGDSRISLVLTIFVSFFIQCG